MIWLVDAVENVRTKLKLTKIKKHGVPLSSLPAHTSVSSKDIDGDSYFIIATNTVRRLDSRFNSEQPELSGLLYQPDSHGVRRIGLEK